MKILLSGIGASPGTVTGQVQIVFGAEDATLFPEGAILVTEMTEPSMVLMMNRAAAIVTNTGGLTSHPAIIARELGIPCVVATKTATTTLQNGMTIQVDGTVGQIYLIEE